MAFYGLYCSVDDSLTIKTARLSGIYEVYNILGFWEIFSKTAL